MNIVPEDFIRVSVEDMSDLVMRIFVTAGMPEDDAAKITELLVITDLRGVFSHGTRQAAVYARHLVEGNMNPAPEQRIIKEGPTTAVIDGDGGLGHFASLQATELAIAKAKELGLGAATTFNHHHFGAAGKYTRLIAAEGCVGFATSSHRWNIAPDPKKLPDVYAVGGGSPMSWAFPHRDQPPVVLDMATSFYFRDDENKREHPAAFFKSLGLGATCAGLGKIMAGVTDLYARDAVEWPASNQGSFILAVNIEHFISMDIFLRDMDAYVEYAMTMKPMVGQDRALLPGALEFEREQQWRKEGIPVGDRHREQLNEIAKRLELQVPWDDDATS